MNSFLGRLLQSNVQLASFVERGMHTTAAQCSVFMKRQKKIDPEVAKQREIRRRKRLEKEIRTMQKHSKKPKPIDEMTLDIKSAKNLHERNRETPQLSTETIDERVVIAKQYGKSRNILQKQDDAWVRLAIRQQTKALRELKELSPALYEHAIQPDTEPIIIRGPALTAPIKEYQAPDGDYVDTTRTWT